MLGYAGPGGVAELCSVPLQPAGRGGGRQAAQGLRVQGRQAQTDSRWAPSPAVLCLCVAKTWRKFNACPHDPHVKNKKTIFSFFSKKILAKFTIILWNFIKNKNLAIHVNFVYLLQENLLVLQNCILFYKIELSHLHFKEALLN